jgi:hypothetical protein
MFPPVLYHILEPSCTDIVQLAGDVNGARTHRFADPCAKSTAE